MKSNKLNESDIKRIVSRVINESEMNGIDSLKEEISSKSRTLVNGLDELSYLLRRGDTRRIDEEKDNVMRHVMRLEDILNEVKQKLRD
jgi:hypothetical protein